MVLKSKFVSLSFILLFSVFFLFSCKEKKQTGEISEGYIKYDIEYMGDSLDKFIRNFLPDIMKIKFKDNCTKNQLQGGVFSFTHIKDYEEEENITLVTLLDKKYKYIEKLNEPSLFFESRPDIQIELTEDTKEIAGYTCKRIHIKNPDGKKNLRDFDIYYTDEIKIKGFNNHTPYQAINGVLMEFQLEFYGIPLKFSANEVKSKNISDHEFEIPEGYKRINRKTMKEIIELLK